MAKLESQGMMPSTSATIYRVADDEYFWYVEGGNKEIRVKGAGIFDISFSHEDPRIQTINISRIQQAIKDRSVPFRKQLATFMPENMREVLKLRDIDNRKLEWILGHPEVYDEPILMVGDRWDDMFIIDGTHRCAAHYHMKDLQIKTHSLAWKDLPQFRIRMFVNGKEFVDTRDSVLKSFEYNKRVKDKTKLKPK